MIPITIHDAMIARLILEGYNTGQIIDMFKEHEINIDRTDVRRGTELLFWINIPEAIRMKK